MGLSYNGRLQAALTRHIKVRFLVDPHAQANAGPSGGGTTDNWSGSDSRHGLAGCLGHGRPGHGWLGVRHHSHDVQPECLGVRGWVRVECFVGVDSVESLHVYWRLRLLRRRWGALARNFPGEDLQRLHQRSVGWGLNNMIDFYWGVTAWWRYLLFLKG